MRHYYNLPTFQSRLARLPSTATVTDIVYFLRVNRATVTRWLAEWRNGNAGVARMVHGVWQIDKTKLVQWLKNNGRL